MVAITSSASSVVDKSAAVAAAEAGHSATAAGKMSNTSAAKVAQHLLPSEKAEEHASFVASHTAIGDFNEANCKSIWQLSKSCKPETSLLMTIHSSC